MTEPLAPELNAGAMTTPPSLPAAHAALVKLMGDIGPLPQDTRTLIAAAVADMGSAVHAAEAKAVAAVNNAHAEVVGHLTALKKSPWTVAAALIVTLVFGFGLRDLAALASMLIGAHL